MVPMRLGQGEMAVGTAVPGKTPGVPTDQWHHIWTAGAPRSRLGKHAGTEIQPGLNS